MNLVKIHLFKDTRTILKSFKNICKKYDINANRISIIATVTNKYPDFYIFCDEKDVQKINDPLSIYTPNCGKCDCYIKSFEFLRKKLLENDWYSDNEYMIILDLSHRYEKMKKDPTYQTPSIIRWLKEIFF